MSNDWERIAAVFEAAVIREPSERLSFVRDASAGDADLRRQVESMLAEIDRPVVIDRPVDEAIAELFGDDSSTVVGTQLGPYRVESLLGVGGMGEVYRATDTLLGRQVAIKILPADLSADPERLARFRREARILASLNHPGIAAIYGLETLEGKAGPSFGLVLELVEGPTLADTIRAGRLPVAEALALARQIAEALEAAHLQGIVHRDLKPANIKVREDGAVKVLDFGLARLAQPDLIVQTDAAKSPTITSPAMVTGAGMILGTAAYMAPEQAKGRPADKRSDIWALGCVLYEMLTGTRPFAGDDVPEVLAAVLTKEPDWTLLPSDLSPTLGTYLRRCLYKQPKQRIADAQDIRLALEGAFETAAPASDASSRTRWRTLALLAGAALVGGAAAGAAMWFATPPAAPRVTRFALPSTRVASLSMDPVGRDVTVLPDGAGVVYAANNAQGLRQIFLHAVDKLEPTLLVGAGRPRAPFVSPDGQWVGFIDIGVVAPEIKKVAVAGGSAVTLCLLDGVSRGITWGDDGNVIFATSNPSTGLQRVPSTGGKPVVLTTPDHAHGEADHLWPQYLPGSQAVLFTITSTTGGMDGSLVAVLDLRTGERKVLVPGGSQALYTPTGHLVYAAAGSLRAVAFDARRLEVHGTPTPVLPQVAATPAGTAQFDIALDGTLVYMPAGSGADPRTLVWVDRQGREEPVKGAPPRSYTNPSLSPDGTRLALGIRDQENDIWVWNFARETLTRVTYDPGLDGSPVWMPDGRRIVYASGAAPTQSNGLGALFLRDADGAGGAERLTKDASLPLMIASSVSPDGTRLVAWTVSGGAADLMMLTLSDRRVQPLMKTPFIERNGEVSPDGRWLAYESNASGQAQVYVRPFPDVNGGQWQVSAGGGTQPVWARDGQELFYVAPDALRSVRVSRGVTWAATASVKVLDGQYFLGTTADSGRTYDVSADGRFLMIKGAAPDPAVAPAGIVVVQNWFEELKRLVPAK